MQANELGMHAIGIDISAFNSLIANDRYNMYPTIVEKSGMKIVNQYKRSVLNRTEKNKSAYAEMNLKRVA